MMVKILLMMLTVIALGLANATTVGAITCEEAFDKASGAYECHVKADNGEETVTPLSIVSPPGSGDFGIEIFGVDHNCVCLAKGSFNNPKFRQSLEFLCNDNGVSGDAMVAKVTGNGKKIKNGQYQFIEGEVVIVFECETIDEVS